MPHLTSIEDLSDADVDRILTAAHDFKAEAPGRLLDGRLSVSAFFEPSTRTRLSFESAALRLGAQTLGFSDAQSTSTAKGESLEDSVRVLAGYGDVIVLRHPDTGAATQAAAVSDVPIINAGDGRGEHPTQALLDLATMQARFDSLKGRKVALVGDLANGRTVHSLQALLARQGANISQVPVDGLGLPDVPQTSLQEAAREADVLYMTRIQKERMSGKVDPLVLDPAWLHEGAMVLHPLPRLAELPTVVDAHAAANYFEQARNGVPTRMAVLAWALGELP